MNINQSQLITTILAGVAVAGVLYLVKRGADKAAQVIKEDLNPASDKNIVYGGVNSVGEAVTGDKDFSLGSWLYEVLNPEQAAKDNSITDPVTVRNQEYYEDRRLN